MINSPFVHFQTREQFDKLKNDISDRSIVFIKDTQEIYQSGSTYGSLEILESEISLSKLTNIAKINGQELKVSIAPDYMDAVEYITLEAADKINPEYKNLYLILNEITTQTLGFSGTPKNFGEYEILIKNDTGGVCYVNIPVISDITYICELNKISIESGDSIVISISVFNKLARVSYRNVYAEPYVLLSKSITSTTFEDREYLAGEEILVLCEVTSIYYNKLNGNQVSLVDEVDTVAIAPSLSGNVEIELEEMKSTISVIVADSYILVTFSGTGSSFYFIYSEYTETIEKVIVNSVQQTNTNKYISTVSGVNYTVKIYLDKSVTTLYRLFYGLSIKTVDFSNFDMSNITNIGNICHSCKSLTSVNFSNCNFKSITEAGYAFYYCSSLTSIDLSYKKLDSILYMNGMFELCQSLTSINLNNFITNDTLLKFAGMFKQCKKLTSIDISGFNMSNVTDINLLFSECYLLSTVYFGITSKTFSGNVESMWYSSSVNCYCYYGNLEFLSSIKSGMTERANGLFLLKSIYITSASNTYGNTSKIKYNLSYSSLYKSISFSATGVSDYIESNDTGYDRTVLACKTIGNIKSNCVNITLYAKGAYHYTVDLNALWQLSSSQSNPDESVYDGVYESFSNTGVSSSGATMYINLVNLDTFTLYIRSYAESCCDYVMVSLLDLTITKDTSYSNTTLVKASTRQTSVSSLLISGYTKVLFTDISAGEHTITIVYRKDSSVNSYNDKGYVLIPINLASSTYLGIDKITPDSDYSYCKINGSQVFENYNYEVSVDSTEEKYIYIHSTYDYKIKINNFDPESLNIVVFEASNCLYSPEDNTLQSDLDCDYCATVKVRNLKQEDDTNLVFSVYK